MDIKLIKRKNILIVRLTGELDHHTALKLKQTIEQELSKNTVLHLVINLKELSFIDSSGIGVILGRYRQFKEKGGQVVLCGLNRHTERILQMGGVLKVIKAFHTENEAINALG